VQSAATINGVSIIYSNLTQSACNHFGNGIATAAGLIQTQINGSGLLTYPPLGTSAPLTVSQVSTGCVPGNTNSFTATFGMN
jgi:hypothetical protein